jgi:hypothetical protein
MKVTAIKPILNRIPIMKINALLFILVGAALQINGAPVEERIKSIFRRPGTRVKPGEQHGLEKLVGEALRTGRNLNTFDAGLSNPGGTSPAAGEPALPKAGASEVFGVTVPREAVISPFKGTLPFEGIPL